MKAWSLALVMALLATAAVAATGSSPYTGARIGTGFAITVIDEDIDAAFELVTADTGFTALSAAANIRVEYAGESKLDSLRAGSGTGDLVGVFTDGTSADQTAYANFFQDRGTGTVSAVAAAWGQGYSPEYDAYLTRWDDNDFNLGDEWAVAVFSRGLSPGNPGEGTVQTIFSLGESPQQLRIEYDDSGFLAGIITDDGNASIDSITYAVDVYDSTWNMIVFSCASSTLRLRVNDAAAQTASLSNASQVLSSVDTLVALATRGGSNPFRGHIDELYIENGGDWLDVEMEEYLYDRYLAANSLSSDTALVRMVGVGSDTMYKAQLCTVAVNSGDQTDSTYVLFENAWAEESQDHPMLVFSGGSSPRGTLLDSIPQDRINYPIAHVYFDNDQTGVLDQVEWVNYGANAITYQLRVYHTVYGVIDFTKDYDIKAPAYIPSGGTSVVYDFGPNGLYLGPNTAIAAYAKGGGANAKGSVTLIGRRRWLR